MSRLHTILRTTLLTCSTAALVVIAVLQPAEPAVHAQAAVSCITDQTDCKQSGGMAFASFDSKPKPKTVHKPSRSVPETCSPDPSLNLAYEQQLSATLAATNTQVDAVRGQALNNGESYQSFDSQLNSLFAAYDTAVQNEYSAYVASLHGCTPLSTPQLFDMFTP